jgi:hypothetical protein
MSSGLDWLDGVDVAGGDPNSGNFDLPVGNWRCITDRTRVVEFDSKEPGKPKRRVFMVTFRGLDQVKGKSLDRRVSLAGPDADDERKKMAQDNLARLFKDLGVPKERMNSVKPEDLDGIRVVAQVYDNKGGYRTLGKIRLDTAPAGVAAEVPLSAPSTPSGPAKDDFDLPDDF